MNLKSIFCFFTLVISVILSNNTYAQLYTYRNFNHRDGLTTNSVLTVEEDKNGYIWLGTDGAGLVRYDGEKFEDIESKERTNRKHVSTITFDTKNKILFGTLFKGFYAFYDREEQPLSYISKQGKARKIIAFKNDLVVLQDASVQIFSNEEVVDEIKIYPLNEHMEFIGSSVIDQLLFLFTSRGNYVVYDQKIRRLNQWLGTSREFTEDMVNIYRMGDSLMLTDNKLSHEITVLTDHLTPKFFIRDKISADYLDDDEVIVKTDTRFNTPVFLSDKGNIFKLRREKKGYRLAKLADNSHQAIQAPTDLTIDKNKDIWITTGLSGVFRVSLEPFTKLNLHEVYDHPGIVFIHRTRDGEVLISTTDGETFLGEITPNNEFSKFPFTVKSSTFYKGETLLATDKGLYTLKNNTIRPSRFSFFKNKSLSLVDFCTGDLWVAEKGGGLYVYNKNASQQFEKIKNTAAFIYTSQCDEENKITYFGGNTGVFRMTPFFEDPVKLPRIVDSVDLGYYVGNSVKDAHGTYWFTFDEGLLGILKSGEIKQISDDKFFPSKLFYTLNSDSKGNLIIGTNRGITVLNVDENANVHRFHTYTDKSGFGGYETHMRSAFQDKNRIFLGTLEGLFLVNTGHLFHTRTPSKPVITRVVNKLNENLISADEELVLNHDENSLSITFQSINNKSNQLLYSYRLKGLSDEWSAWSYQNSALFSGLKGGEYKFEVRASPDAENLSEITSLSFKVFVPFYMTKWFIISIIGLAILLNLYLLERTKGFSRKNIILSRDLSANKAMVTTLLLFGALVNTITHVVSTRLDATISPHDLITIVTGFMVLILFCLLAFSKRFNNKASLFLMIGFFVILAQNFWGLYISDIHPFFLVNIVIILAITPVVFRSLKAVIALGLLMVLMSFIIVGGNDETNYNGVLFLIAVTTISLLTILLTYIRNTSLEKLIFTSGVVNKGNVLVVGFNNEGKISYTSENLKEVLGIDVLDLKGRDISFLNKYKPPKTQNDKFNDTDLKNDFTEGKIFVTPLFNKANDIVFYQWSCKRFSDDVKVILGQDVTEKINLERYYELIVNNADDLIYQTDPFGKFTFVNNKCVEAFELERAKIINTEVDLLIHPDYQEKVQEFYRNQFINRIKTTYLEFPILTGKGNTKWLGQNITAMFKPGTDDFITGFLGLARDITDRRKAETIIKEQNKNITDSISYARRIQFNMLPRFSQFEEQFKEHFIFFKPKDIVSGDFYWLEKIDNKIIVVCSDSTGHGVPGAFMTLLGINILNQIILEGNVLDPAEILNQLDSYLIDVLPRDGRNRVNDGMETVVCVFDQEEMEVEYATAGGRFIIARESEDELTVLKKDIKHIGDIFEDDFSYQKGKISITKNDAIYLFTDGYPDQFGGAKNKKLTFKKFQALLNGLKGQEMSEQNSILQDHFKAWTENTEQTDDITVIGIRGFRKKETKD